jgi:hypothetical protein
MVIRRFVVALIGPVLLSGAALTAQQGPPVEHPQPPPEPPMAGIHWARGQAGQAKVRPPTSPDLTYHGGPVMHGTVVAPIYWGTSWDSTLAGDKQTSLASFYQGIGGSSYAATNTEYTDFTAAHVSSAVTYQTSYVDTSAAPSSGSRTAPILKEVCAVLGTNAVPNGYYPVYVDSPRGHSGFCAWHSAGTCPNGTPVQFAFFYNLDGDAGCNPQDNVTGHSQGVAALANVSGHELSEMLTDPQLNAWFDGKGDENSDKCAWTFGPRSLTFSNGSQWKIQGNWSNAARSTASGYDGAACIDGGS